MRGNLGGAREAKPIDYREASDGAQGSPTARALRTLAELGLAQQELEIDPTGFLRQLLLPPTKLDGSPSLTRRLIELGPRISEQLLKKGPPRNPDAEEVIRELFSPQLVRQAIVQAYEDPKGELRPLACAVMLSMMYQPAATLAELNLLRYQALTRLGCWPKVILAMTDGLTDACKVVPALWVELESVHELVVQRLRDKARIESHFLVTELVKWPAFVVDRVLADIPSTNQMQAEDLLNRLSMQLGGILDNPGLLPVVRYLRASAERIPRHASSLFIDAVYEALHVEGDSGGVQGWIQAHLAGDPVRYKGQAWSIAHALLSELLTFEEMRAECCAFGDGTSQIVAGMKSEHDQILRLSRKIVEKAFKRTGLLKQLELQEINTYLKGYGRHALFSFLRRAQGVLNKEPSLEEPQNGCEYLLDCAAGWQQPTLDTVAHLAQAYSNSKDPAYRLALRVAVRDLDQDELTEQLKQTVGKPEWNDLLAVWSELPERCDAALFYSLLLCANKIPKLKPWMLVDSCKRWGNLGDQQLVTEDDVSTEFVGIESVEYFTKALEQIRNHSPAFLEWRTALVRSILVDSDLSALIKNYDPPKLLDIVYQEAHLEELQQSPTSLGLRSRICSLKLSKHDGANFNPRFGEILAEINRLLNDALSDYALERATFTSVPMLLQRYGHTARSLAQFKRELEASQALDSSSQGDSTLLKAITLIQRAYHKGVSVDRLRRELARYGLIRYQKDELSLDTANDTYLQRYGLQQAVPTVSLPTLLLLRQVVMRDERHPTVNQGEYRPLRVIPQNMQELDALIEQCRSLLKSELTKQRPFSLRDVIDLRNQLRYPRLWMASALAGAGITAGADLLSQDRDNASQEQGRYTTTGQAVTGSSGLFPNGSLPSEDLPLAKLRVPTMIRQNAFLMHGLVGADPNSAMQPPLDDFTSRQLQDWAREQGSVTGYESMQLEPLADLGKSYALGRPLGAVVNKNSEVATVEDGPGLKRGHDQISFAAPLSPDLAPSSSAADVRAVLGPSYASLWRPRLPFATVQEISPELAEAITSARSMGVQAAAQYLRGVVARLLAYEEVPTLERFDEGFERYFREILRLEEGICGQHAVVLDEVFKQAGIPSCIALVYAPQDDGVTYSTHGSHATNIAILLSSNQKPVPQILDATIKEASSRLFVLGFLALGSGIALASFERLRRDRLREREALAALRENTQTDDVATPERQSMGVGVKEEISTFSPTPPSHEEQLELLFGAWLLHVSDAGEGGGLAAQQGVPRRYYLDNQDLDISSMITAHEARKQALLVPTSIGERVLSRTELDHTPVVVGIINAWARSMQDLGSSKGWLKTIDVSSEFTKKEKAILRELAELVGPEDARPSVRKDIAILVRWGRPDKLSIESFLRAFRPE